MDLDLCQYISFSYQYPLSNPIFYSLSDTNITFIPFGAVPFFVQNIPSEVTISTYIIYINS